MKAPSFILGACLIFWGWQTGLLILAVIMALVLEGARFVNLRWDFATSDFNRISDLCAVIFLGMLIYSSASENSTPVVLVVLQWLPISLFPLMASQAYSTSEDIDVRALFLLLRRKGTEGQNKEPITMNPTYPYFSLCILSASAANVREVWFYVGLLFLSAWALLPIRPNKRYSLILWACLLFLAGSAGYVGHVWLHRVQGTVEDRAIEWFSQFRQKESDTFRARSAIGDIGTLKLSDRILFRVKMQSHGQPPFLLRENSFNIYRSLTWFARKSEFIAVQPTEDETTWKLQTVSSGVRDHKQNAAATRASKLTVSSYLRGNNEMLKLPLGAFRIEKLPVVTMEQNQYGTVKVNEGPGLVNYRVHYARNVGIDSLPTEADLNVPTEEKNQLQKIVAELGGQADSPWMILNRIARYFRKNFTYSLTLSRANKKTTPLEDFMFKSRSGHCEYFAAETVLLLRTFGIPARYATGYSVHEYSDLEKAFVVRQRHAHAWTLVYLDGDWQDFDTTPASWIKVEEDAASKWGGILDLWSWCMYTLSKWRWSESRGSATKYIVWLLIPLSILLTWRVYHKKRVNLAKKDQEHSDAKVRTGADSEFYLIAARLGELGFARHPGETLSNLIARVEESQPPLVAIKPLQSILELHYRYRFDPRGISSAERSALRSNVQSWLEEHRM